MAQKRRDSFQRHASVDGLGGEGVTQLVRRDAPESGMASDLFNSGVHSRCSDPAPMVGEQVVRTQGVAPSTEPLVEEGFKLRMEWDVAIAVQLADRHPQPVRRANLDNGIDGQIDELAATQASAGEHLHTQAGERIGVGPCCPEQFGRRRIVEKAWQRLVEDREVAGKEQDASRSVIACPFRETSERHAEGSQVTGYRSAAQQRRTITSW